MMKRFLLGAFLLLPLPLAAQEPGGVFQISAPRFGVGYFLSTAVNGQGDFIVAWATNSGVHTRTFARGTTTPSSGEFQVGGPSSYYRTRMNAAAGEKSFLVTWDSIGKYGIHGLSFTRELEENGEPLGGIRRLGEVRQPSLAIGAHGSLLVAKSDHGIFSQRLDATGRLTGRRIALASTGAYPRVVPGADGGFVAIWSSPELDLFGRLLNSDGSPRGPVFPVASPGLRLGRVFSSPDGRFLVAWNRQEGIFGRLYGRSGAPRTPVFQMSPAEARSWDVTFDAQGKFLVVWIPGDGSVVRARRFQTSGAPAGEPFRLVPRRQAPLQEVTVAVEPDGTFLLTWSELDAALESRIMARRFH